MSAPLKEGLEYYPHDTHPDEKIQALVAICGLAGKGFYHTILEIIYAEGKGELDLSDDDVLQVVIRNMYIDGEIFDKLLNTCLKQKLFDKKLWQEGKVLTSNGIKKRINRVEELRKNARGRYHKSKGDGQGGTDVLVKPDKENTGILFQLYEENIGILTPLIAEELKVWEYPQAWYRDAFKEACDHNARNIKYVKAILDRWLAKGRNNSQKLVEVGTADGWKVR